ncbi:WD40 repeat-like protein [Serendipita vermifera]|nr:WD40 repeat-like protein [Serendipita vermifera]
MNISLLNPFETQSLPTTVRATLDSGAVIARFDKTGRFVAAGTRDGSVFLWDLATQAVVRNFEGHVRPVTGLSWSRNSRFLLTASRDWNVVVWDLASKSEPPQRYSTIRFDAPVVTAFFHPLNSNIILAILATGEAFVVDRRPGEPSRVDLRLPVVEEGVSHRVNVQSATFSSNGSLIFLGTSDGAIVIFNCRKKSLVNRVKIQGSGAIRNVCCDPCGRYLATNSTDRNIRLFPVSALVNAVINSETVEPIARMTDAIARTRWTTLMFTGDGDNIFAGSDNSGAHDVSVWDVAARGQYVKSIENGKEPLIDLDWHPHLSEWLSVSGLGNIYIWGNVPKMKWSAFAAEFEEIDENVEYTEKETEFDQEDKEEAAKRTRAAEDADVDVGFTNRIIGPERGGRIMLGRTASEESALLHDEDEAWAKMGSELDNLPWTFSIVIDEFEEE